MIARLVRAHRKRHRRSHVMTAGHRHRDRLNSLASRLEKRAKPFQIADALLFIWFFLCILIVAPDSKSDFSYMIGGSGIVAGCIRMIVATVESKLTDLARRLRVETPTEKLRRDQRPPVLYLRSFVRDDEASRIYQMHADGAGMIKSTIGSEEELLVKVFDRVGPVIAIGNPHDTTPIIGAARYYLHNPENWTEIVEKLLDKAAIVVLHAGHTAGLLWELKAVIRKVSPERLILLSSLTAEEYYIFRESAATAFPLPLPDYGRVVKNLPSTIKAFITFDADWTPHFIRMPLRWLSSDGVSYLNATLPKVFGPFLARLEAARNPLTSKSLERESCVS